MEQVAKETAYRVYVTDALRVITENTAAVAGGHYINERFINRITPVKEETRTESEIVDQIRRKIAEVK